MPRRLRELLHVPKAARTEADQAALFSWWRTTVPEWKEANARVEIGPLYALYNIPHISQVYLLFRARLLDLEMDGVREGLAELAKLETVPARRFARDDNRVVTPDATVAAGEPEHPRTVYMLLLHQDGPRSKARRKPK